MKSNRKTKTISLIILGIFFAFLPISINNPTFSARDRDITSNYNDEFDHDNLKLSAVQRPIHIDGNLGWAAFKAEGNCTGSGTSSNPYVIKNLEIDGGGSGSCILIENSDVYFRIEDCNLYNTGWGWGEVAGIKLYHVDNGKLIDNRCNNCEAGIFLEGSSSNAISGNTVNNNSKGIYLRYSSNENIISGNTASNNTGRGIYLGLCVLNIISGNTLNYNEQGIELESSAVNTILENKVNYNEYYGINLDEADSNDIYLNCFSNNSANAEDTGLFNNWDNAEKGNYWSDYTGSDEDSNGIGDVPYNIGGSAGSQDNFPLMKCPTSAQNSRGIPGYNLFILFGILSILTIYISKRIKKS